MGFLGAIGGAIGSAVTGAGSFLGDVLSGGGISQANAQAAANEQNIQLSRDQMAFQERMANSAYQRAMQDMGKAGLNPMLAFSQGGAATPSGASTTVSPVNKGAGKILSGAAGGLQNIMQLKPQMDNVMSQTRLNENNADVAEAKKGESYAAAENLDVRSHESRARQRNMFTENENAKITQNILKERHRTSAAEADEAEMARDIQANRQKVDKGMAPYDAGLERIEQAVGAVTGARGAFRSRRRPGVRTSTTDINGRTGEVMRERVTKTEDSYE